MMLLLASSLASAYEPETIWWHLDQVEVAPWGRLSTDHSALFIAAEDYRLFKVEEVLPTSMPVLVPSQGEDYCGDAQAVRVGDEYQLLCSIPVQGILRWETSERVADDSWLLDVVPDIDGDGYDELFGRDSLHLYRPTGFERVEYPPPNLEALDGRRVPISDLTGDGRSDLIASYFVDEEFFGYFYNFDGGVIELHPGQSGGYGEPLWRIELDQPLFEALPLQLDDDPQLELLGLIADGFSTLSPDFRSVYVVRIDFDDAGQPASQIVYDELPDAVVFCHVFCEPRLESVGDVDGDGYDDVLLAISYQEAMQETSALHILTGANGFDLTQPLLRLRETSEQLGPIDLKQVLTADLNGDGRLDVAMARDNGRDLDSSTIQVWFAPFLEPDPTLTDTAAAASTDSSASNAAPSKNRRSGDQGCGCQGVPSPGPWLAMALPWFLGRRSPRRRP
jgi:hypothetical protein